MALHYPDLECTRYIRHFSPDVAEFEIDSPFCFADDGAPDPLNILVGTLDDGRWEFCCVEAPGRCPDWMEMKHVRDLCWDLEDVVMQLHPQASRYINESPFSLWQWRPTFCDVPQPPLWRERPVIAER